MKAWHKNSSLQKKKLWKKVNFWPSYGNLSDLTPRHPRLCAKLVGNRKSLKKCPNSTEFFFERCKKKKRDTTHQIKVFWCVLRPFFLQKTSTFRYLDKKNPPSTFFETVLHPFLWKFFNAIFDITREKDEIMISWKIFKLCRAVFYGENNLVGSKWPPPCLLKG